MAQGLAGTISTGLVQIMLLAGGLALSDQGLSQAWAQAIEIEVEGKKITHFQVGNRKKIRFGALRYISGLEYWSLHEDLGGISGIRILEGGRKFLAVSDQGKWFTATLERDPSGKIIAISNAKIAPLLKANGRPITSKRRGDAEGLEIFGDRVLVSFERRHRINNYPLDLQHLASVPKPFRPSIKKLKLPNNSGLEAIAVLTKAQTAKLSKSTVVVFSENSIDKNGNIRGFISTRKKWKKFSVKAIGGYKITDATMLPDGDLLLLERQYSVTTGPLIRMRRISIVDIKPGAVVEGEILFSADNRFQIDNLEGVSAWVNDENQTILTIVSDNNFSFLQRNLMLEFELLSDEN